MSKSSIYNPLTCCSLFMLLVTASCHPGENTHHGVKDKIENESKNFHGTSISSEEYLADYNLVEITEGEFTFLIPERKSQITSFACTECHTVPLSELQQDDETKNAHWNIKIVHANQNTMNCATCHNTGEMDNLKSLTGNRIDFNDSYNLCSQCHSKQFDDWKGGAHGKRLGGWAPPRAAMTCVNCHNPHQPQVESRWPARFNTQTVQERE